ncbi:MAG: hypothetical protein RLZZ227_2194 [Pseudomonadota bacterium]|jgi:predicted aminopeptidase
MRNLSLSKWLALITTMMLGACDTLGYYTQAVSGQLYILTHRQKIEGLLDNPATDPGLRARLGTITRIRAFAGDSLALPVESHYATYVDLQRSYVVWNVFAAPEFSMEPRTWCYPVVGCVSYRGYFNEKAARDFARELKDQDLDVYVSGIVAYSTLGWFSDPVLNTLMNRQEHQLAALLFHELAHQVVYVRGDTEFNESFATAVEREGQRRWLEANTAEPSRRAELETAIGTERQRQQQFIALVQSATADLRVLYASTTDESVLRREKALRFERLRADYAELKKQWKGYSGYDPWFAGDLNNAKLATVTTYNNLVPGFTALLAQQGGDLAAFYRRVAEMAELSYDERRQVLATALASR